MIQPKYSPEEALNKIKLMMNYDSSKTLNENKNVIEEQTIGKTPTSIGAAGIGSLAGFGLGSAAAATAAASVAAATAAGTSASLGATIGTFLPVPILGTLAGAAIGLGVGALIDWAANKDHGSEDFKSLMEFCKNTKVVDSIPKGLDDNTIRSLSRKIEDAKVENFEV